MARKKAKKKKAEGGSSWNLYRSDELVHSAPPHPYAFVCPDCGDDYPDAYLRFGYSMSEQWGCVVTRHDFSRCPVCKGTYVSTNGGEPDLACDEYKIKGRPSWAPRRKPVSG